MVLARGNIPADIVLVGEAPGRSEDELIKPFCGPAGHLLDEIISQSIPDEYTYAITNMIACIPYDDEEDCKSKKTREPDCKEIRACRDRLKEFIELCNPRLVVCVGSVARDYINNKTMHGIELPKHIHVVNIDHPAYMLRVSVAQRSLVIQRAIVTISNAIEDHLEESQ